MNSQVKEKLSRYITTMRDMTNQLWSDYNALQSVYLALENVNMALSTDIVEIVDQRVMTVFAQKVEGIRKSSRDCSRYLTELGAFDKSTEVNGIDEKDNYDS